MPNAMTIGSRRSSWESLRPRRSNRAWWKSSRPLCKWPPSRKHTRSHRNVCHQEALNAAHRIAGRGGRTADQIAVRHIGQDTPLPSLEVATDNRGGGGFCDRDYGCSYAGTISFRTPTTPLPMEIDPRKLFTRLFGQGDNAAERARMSKQYTSLLDMVGEEVGDLQRGLGPSDKAMLSDYLESVREIER